MSDRDYDGENQDLEFTRNIRKQAVGLLVNGGIPVSDSERMKILTTVLTDIDRSALGRMKIKSDDKGNAGIANAQSAIAELLSKLDPSKVKLAGRCDRGLPVLGSEIPSPVVNPGETAIGTQGGTYEEFSKEHFKQA